MTMKVEWSEYEYEMDRLGWILKSKPTLLDYHIIYYSLANTFNPT